MIQKSLLIALLLLLAFYAGDYLFLKFRIPGNRQQFGVVQTRISYAVVQKNRKTEYYFDPPQNQTCSHSIFPQLGYRPCWYLERNRVKLIQL